MEALHGELLGRDKLRLGDDLLSRGELLLLYLIVVDVGWLLSR